MSRSLLVIGAGRLQVAAFAAGKRLGLRVVGVDRNPQAPGLAYADAVHVVDTHDVPRIVDVARRERVDAVVTLCTDFPVRAVAAVSTTLGLPGISPRSAELATHKGRMREALAVGGAPIPAFRRVRTIDEARTAALEIGLPVVLKPPASSGSRGIFHLNCLEDLAQAVAHASKIAGTDEFLVEEYVSGPELSVETLSFGGEHHVVAITDKSTTGSPFWVETGHLEPSRLPGPLLAAIKEAALSGLRALAVDNAAGHVEIKVGSNGPQLIEIGARLGGDFITTELVPRSTGVDMVEAVIRIALGETPVWRPRYSRGAAIRYLLAPRGEVTGVSGLEDAMSMPGVVRLEVDVKPGDQTASVQSSLDRPGFVIAEGQDADEAEERASAAAARIRILVREAK